MYRYIRKKARALVFQRCYGCRIYGTASIVPNNRNLRENIVVGTDSHIRGELLTFGHGGTIKIGRDCYVGENTRIWSAASIVIGDRVLISHNSNIFDNDTHPISAVERHLQFRAITTKGHPNKLDLKEEPVVIHNDVLIGCNSVILKGVTLGTGAIIGAGSVVTRDVDPWTIVAGNPARVIREIPADER